MGPEKRQAAGSVSGVGAAELFQANGHTGNGQIVKHRAHRHLDAGCLVDPGNNPERGQRISAEIDKIILKRNSLHAEHISPDLSEHNLGSARLNFTLIRDAMRLKR